MTIKAIPFVPNQASGNDPLAGASPISVNVMLDGAGALTRRPGLAMRTQLYTALNGVSGLHAATDGKLYAVDNHPTAKTPYVVVGSQATDLTGGVGSGKVQGTRRPSFAETGALLVISAGGAMQKIVRSSGASSIVAGSPPLASHVIAHASRLLANDLTVDRSAVRYSDVANGNTVYAGHESWTAGAPGGPGFFYANARPDDVVALLENTDEVFVFGATNLQVFSPDATFAYSPTVTREYGCAAPYSVIRYDQAFAWLDDKRRLVVSDGRSYQVISDPIKATLDSMATVSDCYGYRVHTGQLDALVWTFPSGGRTLVYQKGAGWSTWAGYDNLATNYTAFPVTAHALMVGSNENVVGVTVGGESFVARFDPSALTDFGEAFNASSTTGFEDHGTGARKHCRAVHLTLRRGQLGDASAFDGQPTLEWRDDEGPWSAPVAVPMSPVGDYQPVVTLRTLGVYRRRQWRFSFHGSTPFSLASALEDFEVLST